MPSQTRQTTNNNRVQWTAAKRMLQLLTKVRDQQGASLAVILPVVLKLKNSDTNYSEWDAMQSQRLVANMIDDVKREIERSSLKEETKHVYARDLLGVMNALSPTRMALPAAQAKTLITDVLLMRFEYLDLALQDHITESELEPDELAQLLESIDAALAALRACSIPDKLKDFIFKQLLNIKIAVDQYRFRGITGIEDALAGYYGALGISHTELQQNLSSDEKGKLKKVVELGQVIINLAHSGLWLWPHLVKGAEEFVKYLSAS